MATCNSSAVALDERIQSCLVIALRYVIGEFSDGIAHIVHGASGLGDGLCKSRKLLQLLIATDAVDDRLAPGIGRFHHLNESPKTSVAAVRVHGCHTAIVTMVPVAVVPWIHQTTIELGEFTACWGSARLRLAAVERFSIGHNNLRKNTGWQRLLEVKKQYM